MDSLILQVAVLYIAVCFGPSHSQGSRVFQPNIRNVTMTKHFHRLKMEWDVHGDSKSYSPETELIFNIQVNQTEENHIVLNTNYSVALSKLNQSLEWSWDPLVPLECEPHVIRIRSLLVDKIFPYSKTWSDWSPWEGVTGLDTMDDKKNYVFPDEHTVKASSNVTFCCIAKKTAFVRGFSTHNTNIYSDRKQRRELFHLKDVSQEDRVVACILSSGETPGTYLYVIEPPDKPKHLSCETEDMKTLICSWKANKNKHPNEEYGSCEREFILSDVAHTKTYCKKLLDNIEDSCSFTIEGKQIPKLQLTAKNCFGEAHTDYDFYVTHKAPSGQLDVWRDVQPGSEKRNVTIFWKPSLDFHANGKIQAYEIWWEKLKEPALANYSALEPGTNSTTIFLDNHVYKIRVSAKNHINSSSPSVIFISKTTGNDEVPEVVGTEEYKINNTHEGIYVSWKPKNHFDGYVVDWYNYPKSHPYDFQWKRFGRNNSNAVIKSDAFRFNVSYTFRIYGTLNNMAYLLEKKKVLYLEEPGDKDLVESDTSVKTHELYDNHFFDILLLLVIIPIMLIICICFWKSSCIRHRCFPTIPKPDVSPFLKRNPETMKICDDVPAKLEVMGNHQISIDKQLGLGMLVIENITYFDPAYHPSIRDREAENKNPNLPSTSYKPFQDCFAVNPPSTSYKPLQDFFAVNPSSSSYKPLQDFFVNKPICQPPPQGHGNFNYLSQMKLPNFRVQRGDRSSSV